MITIKMTKSVTRTLIGAGLLEEYAIATAKWREVLKDSPTLLDRYFGGGHIHETIGDINLDYGVPELTALWEEIYE